MRGDPVDGSGLTVLSSDECTRLLARGGVGRIAVPGEHAPTVRPVNFGLVEGRIVMRTGDGALWAAARARTPASFEFDEIRNQDHRGWSVIVTGDLVPFDDNEGDELPVKVWAPGSKERVVALEIADVSGRRVPDPHAAPVSSRPARSAGVVGATRLVSDHDGDGIDRWGRSARTRTVVRTFMEPAYRHWFRFALVGVERIPMHGGALLVANHAGAIPVDAALVMHGIERELDRAVYGLHHHALAAVPVLGTLLARAGGVVAHPENALRLLRDDGQLVLVFPEGTKGTTKLYRDRYRLARYGRGGFVETAMRAGVPVVPIAVVGSEETMPTVFRVPVGAGQTWPITVNALLFGPIGAVTHVPATITAHVLEPVVFDEPPGLEEYPTFRVADATEMIRSKIQTALDAIVSQRRGDQR
jgi:1-acyl-sn-glycerol-3-phosphate acyltransferase/nitroimidazol reductase NimA-like FMN-containing flavoprotein (pyridoxamine 5'-phosphate oxidase superfamily)